MVDNLINILNIDQYIYESKILDKVDVDVYQPEYSYIDRCLKKFFLQHFKCRFKDIGINTSLNDAINYVSNDKHNLIILGPDASDINIKYNKEDKWVVIYHDYRDIYYPLITLPEDNTKIFDDISIIYHLLNLYEKLTSK